MTNYGGAYNWGVIFEWDPLTDIYIQKIDFDGTQIGASPWGYLTLSNGKFYGTTTRGGVNNKGVIFEWDPVTNNCTKKIDFDGSEKGTSPASSLTLSNGKFYGITFFGGINNNGVIFEWDPLTNIFVKKFDFESTLSGEKPQGSLTLFNSKFYGMTNKGGANDVGVIFEWDPVTNILIKKYDFTGSNGLWPVGSLTSNGTKLYGMTSMVGTGYGVIFEWDPATNIYIKKIDLISSQGCFPQGSLTFNNGQFYGTTYSGGSFNQGVIFKWDQVTNIYTKMIDFNPIPNGSQPRQNLTFKDGIFYGMTSTGGSNHGGVIYKWNPTANTIIKSIDFFIAPYGNDPYGTLTQNAGKFYGMTYYGGLYGDGCIFKWDPATNALIKEIDLNGTLTGSNPTGTLAFYNDKFYGMTYQGGSNNHGVIFEWNPLTNNYAKKIDFDGTSKGCWPVSSLTAYNGKFYGMTYYGGANDMGVIFEWDPATNVFIKKIDFDGINNGSYPESNLTLLNGKFYATTEIGGTFDYGIIFEWDPATNILTRKFNFNGLDNGGFPMGSLTFKLGKFYGMTYLSGIYNMGVIYEWDPFTNVYIKKIDFDGIPKGSHAWGSLTLNSGKFYGMTDKGGTNDKGVIFEWNPVDNSFIKFQDLTSPNGSSPKYTQFAVYNDSTTAAQATNLFTTNVQGTQMNINWIDGSGQKRAVFIKQNNTGTANPANNTAYVANTVFGSGTQIGATGWYCVYNGTTHNSGVTVTNLALTTTYRVMVCEYTGNPGAEHYNTNTAEGNPANFTTTDNSFAIATSSNPADGGTTTGGGNYLPGTQATVTATPNTGHNFVNWTENSTVVSANASYNFTVSGARSLVANFVLQQFTVSTSSNPVAGGTAGGGGTYNYGTQATVTATPSTNWTFLNWTDNGTPVSTLTSYSFTVTANRALVANFTQLPTYIVTTVSNPIAGGITSGGGNYISGQTATVTAAPGTGYNFINWTENGNSVSTTASYSFTVTGARSLVANFELQQFAVTTSSNPANGGNTSGGGTYNYGTQATVTATSTTNWNFINWTENGNIVSLSATYSFTVTIARNLVANFALQQFTISASCYPSNGGYTTGAGTYNYGDQANLSATPYLGKNFVNWTENGSIVSTDPEYSFTVTENRSLVANFELQQFTISTSPNPTDSGSTSGDGTYEYGVQATVTGTANSSWTFLNWNENGNIISTSAVYSFTVTANRLLVANFTQSTTYIIATESSPLNGGETSGGGNYLSGETAIVSATSNTGYNFANWTENGNIVSGDSVYSFTVTGNLNLIANFEPQKFPIGTVSIPSGSGTTNGGGLYNYGSTATVTASSGKSWEFYEWTENCNPVSTNSIYSFIVTAERELAAVFYQPGIQYVTSTVASPIEGGYTIGCGPYNIGSQATVNAIAYPGWEFANWSEGGMPISTNSSYVYTVANHRSLTANFVLYTGQKNQDKQAFRVFPNPTHDKLFVEWDYSLTLLFDEIKLFNTLSQDVYRQKADNISRRMMIDVEGFAPGIYLLVLSLNGNKVNTFKVVVQP